MVFSHSRKRHIKTQPHSRKEVGGLSFFSGSLLGTQIPSTFRLKDRYISRERAEESQERVPGIGGKVPASSERYKHQGQENSALHKSSEADGAYHTNRTRQAM